MQFLNAENQVDKPLDPPQDDEHAAVGWGIPKYGEAFAPINIARHNPCDFDVKVDMHFCGICHTDVHIGLNELGGTMYPCIPGHELSGLVSEIGAKVTKFKVGDRVGMGCMIDSCRECTSCKAGDEQYCEVAGWNHVYNDTKKYGHVGGNPNTQTLGGYTTSQTCNENFVIRIPDNIPLEKAGPIMCAGITLYDPLKHWGATDPSKGKMTIGIVGIGGLGTMGIKFAAALGHRVVAISHSPNKEAAAKEKGADAFIISSDPESMKTEAGKIDLILNTVSASHQISTYTPLLRTNGTHVALGLVVTDHLVQQTPLIFKRQSIAGSLIGGIANTEECLEFCAKHDLVPDIEIIEANKLGDVFQELQQVNKDGTRYVLDIKKSQENKEFMV